MLKKAMNNKETYRYISRAKFTIKSTVKGEKGLLVLVSYCLALWSEYCWVPFGHHTCPQHHETTENHFFHYKIIFTSFDLIIMLINTIL